MLGNVPLVYVVVLTWNGREHTLECLRSICGSDYPNYRILLVDNASSDGTVAAVRTEFPDVEVVVNSSNVGYTEGNNTGIRYAEEHGAEFFFILNNDTVIDHSAVTMLVGATGQDENTYISTPAIYKYSSPDQPAFWGKVWDSVALRFTDPEQLQFSPSPQTAEMIPTASAPGCSLFFGLPVLKKVGLFDNRFFIYWEDTDWCARAVRKGCRIFLVPAAKIWHKESQSFAEPSRKDAYEYYYFRNHLLWIEKNLSGRDQWRAMFRCWRELVKPLLPWYGGGRRTIRLNVFRARFRGARHYVFRRFGAL